MKNIADFLVRSAARYPDYTAIVYRDRRISYRELNARVNRLAHSLLDLGIQKGDRVGVLFCNSSEFVEIFYASVKIGAVVVPVNFRMVSREVKWIVDNSRCKALVYGEACAAQIEPVKKEFSTVEHLIYSGVNVPPGEHDFNHIARYGRDEEPRMNVQASDRAFIIYTGGTTGLPKGAVHTHRSFIYCCINTLIRQHVSDPSESQIVQVPMFHVAGLNLMNEIVAVGGKLVIVESFEPLEILKLIERERLTGILLIPPTTFVRLLDVPTIKDFDTTSVTRVHASAGLLSKQLMLRLFDTFPNGSIYYGYGQSESPVATSFWINRAMVENDVPALKSIGLEHLLVEIRLVDEHGREVVVGEVGEAMIRGPQTLEGYFDQPELTAETIKDGWVSTGDLFRKDKDGFYYFVDRKKDMIKSGGENVFAQEVEEVILALSSVEACAVIGVPDDRFGEAVMAVVKLRQGFAANEEEITEQCKKYLASYKKPRRIAFVDHFPLNASGKIQKFKLREVYSKPEN